MSAHEDKANAQQTRAQALFKAAPADYQTLIRDFVREERDVMHLKRRSDIHLRIVEHVKRVIK